MPKPDIDTLLADPDFQAMEIEGQREILNDISPVFKAKTLEDQNLALGDIRQLSIQTVPTSRPPVRRPRSRQGVFPAAAQEQFTPLQQAALGVAAGSPVLGAALSKILPVTQTEAVAEQALESAARLPGALSELVTRALPPVAALRNVAQFQEAVGRAPAGTASSLDEAISRLFAPATQAPERIESALGVPSTSERAVFRAPVAAELGEALLNIIPVGGIPKVAATVERVGARALSPLTRQSARVTPTVETAAQTSLNLSPIEAQNILPSAVPNITKAAGKAIPTAEEILKAAPQARKALFDEALGGLTKAKEQGLVAKGSSAADDAVEAIQSDSRYMLDNPEQAKALIKKYDKYRRNLDPLEAQGFLEDTNSQLASHWDKTAKGQKLDMTDAELRAEKAFAANLSGQIDDLYKIGSGKLDDPYKQVGSIIEVEKNLKLSQATAQKGFAERVSPSRPRGARVPTTRMEGLRQVERGLTTRFRKNELELLNKNLKKIFEDTPKAGRIIDLPEETIESLRRAYLPGARPSLPPPIPAEAIAPTLEQKIQQVIQNLPREFRGRNERAIAESLLRSNEPEDLGIAQ